ncbi:MAG TPA: PDZ domain-containing protein [Blastocatellia bacterium]|nr:PDZ domain-containing protein [Blastocatellia bacterium]
MKLVHLVTVLILVLGVGVAAASDDQKEKQKEKEAQKAAEKAKKDQLTTLVDDSAPLMTLAVPFDESGYLGVYLEEVTPDRAKELSLSEERGAIVMKVVEGSPAEKAGLKENDVIIGFNGRRVDSVRELQRLLSETPAGRNVSIEFVRGRAHQTVSAALTKRENNFVWRPELDEKLRRSTEEAMKKAQEQLRQSEELTKKYSEDLGRFKYNFGNFNFVGPGEYGFFFSGARLDASLESLTDQLATYFGVKEGKGVLVTHVGENGPAAKAGLKAGDVIVAIDNEPVDDVASVRRAINKKAEGQITLRIVRNKAEQTVTVTLEKKQKALHRLTPVRRATLVSVLT